MEKVEKVVETVVEMEGVGEGGGDGGGEGGGGEGGGDGGGNGGGGGSGAKVFVREVTVAPSDNIVCSASALLYSGTANVRVIGTRRTSTVCDRGGGGE